MKNYGGPAFPTKKWTELVHDESGQIEAQVKTKNHPGMSLRDWFAGIAISEQLRARAHNVAAIGWDQWYEHSAAACYKFADAMLAEREKDSSKST